MLQFVRIVLFVCCFVFSKQNFSQDIRAVWIEYKWISGYTYSITPVILTDDNVNPSNHCSITIYFGDGDSTVLYRCNGSFSSTSQCPTSNAGAGVIISSLPPIRKSIYCGVHTYNGPGNYKLYFTDKYRVTGIKNMVNSSTKSIYVESSLNISQFMGPNSSPIITNYPISFNSVIGNQVKWNPGLTDPDGDSLSYQLINCAVTPTTSYYLPSNATVDAYGTLSFSKDSVGLYAFDYSIKEWRKDSGGNWTLVGTVLMDFVMDIAAGVGIKELDKKETVSIYPNPVSSTLNIRSISKNNSSMEITNSLGQTILKQNYSESVDVSKLVPGYYFIRIDNSYSKFIKE